MESWADMQRDAGKLAEEAGQVLQSGHQTHQELTELRDTLNSCAEVVQTVRDNQDGE